MTELIARGDFLRRQVAEIRREGGTAVLRKLRLVVFCLLAVPFVVLLRLLRPLVLVRIGRLQSDRFGQFLSNTEKYLCDRDAGLLPRRSFDIFYHHGEGGFISNRQLARMWNRHLRAWPFAQHVDRANRLLPGHAAHTLVLRWRDLAGVWPIHGPHLTFTAAEEREAINGMRNLGLPDGAPFICFHARDVSYETASFRGREFGRNARDSSIQDYLPAIDALTQRGYHAVRLGAVVQRPLLTDNPRVVDYATRGRTELLDLYLGARCNFVIASGTGVHNIPLVFRRPVVMVNYMPLELVPAWDPLVLFIPKRLWLRAEERYLTFVEIIESELGRDTRAPFDDLGIDVIDSSPQEIHAVALERDDRIKGRWSPAPEDEELQQRFWSLYPRNYLNQVFGARIGAEFLRQNAALLEGADPGLIEKYRRVVRRRVINP